MLLENVLCSSVSIQCERQEFTGIGEPLLVSGTMRLRTKLRKGGKEWRSQVMSSGKTWVMCYFLSVETRSKGLVMNFSLNGENGAGAKKLISSFCRKLEQGGWVGQREGNRQWTRMNANGNLKGEWRGAVCRMGTGLVGGLSWVMGLGGGMTGGNLFSSFCRKREKGGWGALRGGNRQWTRMNANGNRKGTGLVGGLSWVMGPGERMAGGNLFSSFCRKREWGGWSALRGGNRKWTRMNANGSLFEVTRALVFLLGVVTPLVCQGAEGPVGWMVGPHLISSFCQKAAFEWNTADGNRHTFDLISSFCQKAAFQRNTADGKRNTFGRLSSCVFCLRVLSLPMSGRLFLLDGMALLYRAHFAFMRSPIMTSDGVNTSALYGFANTLLDITKTQQPTHLAVALDTSAPTPRHEIFPAYKAQREEMPEDLSRAIPQIKRLCAAMRIPVLIKDGYEADDIIGTLATRADKEAMDTWMVTPDKDFGQLVSAHVRIYKPGRSGGDSEILGVPEVLAKWGVARVDQIIDVQGLMGDTVDNVPGIPGVGEKTATALIQEHGSIENVIANVDKLKGKLQEKVRQHAELALLSKKLVTIITDAPLDVEIEDLKCQPYDADALKALMVEFEFNSLGRRLFGEDFKAGRGRQLAATKASAASTGEELQPIAEDVAPAEPVVLKNIHAVPHRYALINTAEGRADLIASLMEQERFCFDLETTSLDPRHAAIVGIAFACSPHEGVFALFPSDPKEAAAVLAEFKQLFANGAEKVGHNLKFDLGVLFTHGMEVSGPFFDTMLAHSLLEPDQRHGMDHLSEQYLAYTPVPISALLGEEKPAKGQSDLFGTSDAPITMADVDVEKLKEYAAEDADVTWQLAEIFRPQLEPKGQSDVFYDIESPLLPVLVRMENHGVAIDVQALREFGVQLEKQADALQQKIHGYVETPFNIGSPKQLGEVLFDRLKLSEKPKKTATGQYQTNEQVLQSLMGTHPIIEDILNYREVTKLKSTYVDALPEAVSPITGRVHTTLHQLMTSTGRIASNNPNLQNIPVRSDQGKEIRKAFIAGEPGWVLMSADYSQIELRVMAAISEDKAMLEAFANGHDIHQATAAKVYGVPLDGVLPEMRRTAKMVNFGIIYGISAFGLSQRLGIPRSESAKIIESYFAQFPGVKGYLDRSIEDAKRKGYAETLTGRRRYLRDINSANATVRGAAERIAMNMPIQGTAADMIKLAMVRVDAALRAGGYKTRMLLQVHDELLFEVPKDEIEPVRHLVIEGMRNALPLRVPILVEVGVGENWLAAH